MNNKQNKIKIVDGWNNDKSTQNILERISKLEEEMKDLREQIKNTKSLP